MILYGTKLYGTHVQNLMTIFSEFLCFRNIYSSLSLLFSHLAESTNCDLLLPGLLADFTHWPRSLSTISQWLLQNLKNTRTPACSSKALCLISAIFHTMAFKMCLDIDNNKLTIPIKTTFLKVLYNVC